MKNQVGRKTGFKHSDATIERMKQTKAENHQRKNEIDGRLDLIKKQLYSISKSNHLMAMDLLFQIDNILKSDNQERIVSQTILSIDDAFANLEFLCSDNKIENQKGDR